MVDDGVSDYKIDQRTYQWDTNIVIISLLVFQNGMNILELLDVYYGKEKFKEVT